MPYGFYARLQPRGTQVRRFLCRREGRTVSLLPDCLAARVPGSLEDREQAMGVAEGAVSRTAAAEQTRPPGHGSLASTERWRRVQWVSVMLVLVEGQCPEWFAGVQPTLEGFGLQLGGETVLRRLR